MKNCVKCNKIFTKRFNNQKYCSKICSLSARKENKKEYDKKHHREYYITHLEHFAMYRQNQKKHKQEYDRNYKLSRRKERNTNELKRRKEDIAYKLLGNLRTRIRMALKRNTKSASTTTLVGCSIEFLKRYLESRFNAGMTWDNYGKWHIDHIIPCCKFDLSKEVEQRTCFHYTNLRPLWAEENVRRNKFL